MDFIPHVLIVCHFFCLWNFHGQIACSKQLVAIGLFSFVLHETCSSPSASLPLSKLCSTTYGKELDKVTGQKSSDRWKGSQISAATSGMAELSKQALGSTEDCLLESLMGCLASPSSLGAGGRGAHIQGT